MVSGALGATPAGADPLILPGASVSDHRARIEVSLAEGSARCHISFHGSRRYGPYAVRPGGPTRFVGWRLGRHVSGDWRVRLSCREAAVAGQRTRVTVERTLRLHREGRPSGRLVAAGSLRVGPGSIPELTAERGRPSASVSSGEPVDTTIGEGNPTKFTACRDSRYVKSTRTIGDGVGTYLQIDPTDLAKSSGRSGDEHDPFYTAIWNDVTRCAPLTAVSASQQHSMYVQLACHAKFEWTGLGGNTWDLEAWRQDKDWSAGLNPLRRCGQGYGDVGGGIVGAYLDGRIVNSFPDANPRQRAAWLVQRQPLGFYLRRHIPTTQLYGCLLATGKAPARWYPQHFLDQYVRIGDPVTDGECTAPAPAPVVQPPPVSPQQPQPQPQPPQPVPATKGFFVQDDFLGGTWARFDPGNGTWYSHGNRPPNGKYWFPNGLGVAVDCARSAAQYTVKINGQTQVWSWWAHVTDNTWVPTAVFSAVWSDGNPGVAVC